MFDFLKQFPSVTREEYMWKMTIPQITIAKYDTTHVVYLSEKELQDKKAIKITNPLQLLNEFNLPVIE